MIPLATHLVHGTDNLPWHPWWCLILSVLRKANHSLLRTQLQGFFRSADFLRYLKDPLKKHLKRALIILQKYYGITGKLMGWLPSFLLEKTCYHFFCCYGTRALQEKCSGVWLHILGNRSRGEWDAETLLGMHSNVQFYPSPLQLYSVFPGKSDLP